MKGSVTNNYYQKEYTSEKNTPDPIAVGARLITSEPPPAHHEFIQTVKNIFPIINISFSIVLKCIPYSNCIHS